MSSHTTDPSESSENGSRPNGPRTVIEWHDSSDESDATSRRSSPRPSAHEPEPLPRATYGVRTRVTPRKRVPIPIRRTFRIPAHDEAGPSHVRSRSSTSLSPPPSAVQASVTPPTGLTPAEQYMFSGMAGDVQIHQTLLTHNDQSIDALMSMFAASGQTMNKVIEVLGHTMMSVHQLYSLVYLLMAMVVILLGVVLIWIRL